MENLSIFTSALFYITTACTVFLFYRAANKSTTVLLIILTWILLQTVLSLSGFYIPSSALPPRFIFLILPPVLFCLSLFVIPAGRRFIDRLNPGTLTLLHTVRVAVEFILYALFLEKQVPLLLTFAGSNFDIFSGLTAPFIFYFGFIKKRLSPQIMLVWNTICLALLFLIVYHAILAAPSPFQKYAFEQPNIAILHFPFTLLPAVIVPLVFFSQMVLIRKMLLLFPKRVMAVKIS